MLLPSYDNEKQHQQHAVVSFNFAGPYFAHRRKKLSRGHKFAEIAFSKKYGDIYISLFLNCAKSEKSVFCNAYM